MRPQKIYYAFNGLLTLGMGMVVTGYSPYLLSIGLSLGEISLINAVYILTVIVAELPTGMLADGRSRAFSLKLGAIMYSVGAIVYAFASGIGMAVSAEALVAIGMAFLSGVEQAWIADALAREKPWLTEEEQRKRLKHVYATNAMIGGATMLVGGILGAGLASVSYRLIWIPLIFTGLLASFLASSQMNGQGEPFERVSELDALKKSWALLRTSRDLAWVILATIVSGVVVAFNHFWSPYFIPHVGQTGLAGVWIVMYGAVVASGYAIRKVEITKEREWLIITIAIALAGIGLYLCGILTGFMLPMAAVVIHEFGRGIFKPVSDTFVQHRIESSHRATFGSLHSLLGKFGWLTTPIVVWIAIDGKPDTPETISMVWVAAGLVLVVGAIGLAAVRIVHTIRKK